MQEEPRGMIRTLVKGVLSLSTVSLTISSLEFTLALTFVGFIYL